jgi:hypothetical protein
MNAANVLAASLIAASAACSAPAGSETTADLRIALVDGSDTIAVSGFSRRDLDRLRQVSWGRQEWERLLSVSVAPDAPAMLGTYAVASAGLRFTPRFPLDPGRRYQVTLDPAGLPGSGLSRVVATVGRPAAALGPPATVLNVYPSGDLLPENQLRMYVQFSAPMNRRGGVEHLRILDEQGRELEDPFLPLDAELWNHDTTRFTLLFDPGRVKRGILPNVQMGRALSPGRRYTLVVSREWTDAHGRPLASEFRRSFRVGPPDERPIDPAAWRVEPPAAASGDPLRVIFPKPLDHGLLHSALGVAREGHSIAGDVTVEGAETRWLFTPREPWRAGRHALIVQTRLEDPAGNRIGRAFEVPGGGTTANRAESLMFPFEVRDAGSGPERLRRNQ